MTDKKENGAEQGTAFNETNSETVLSSYDKDKGFPKAVLKASKDNVFYLEPIDT